jgi:hypothetical protein
VTTTDSRQSNLHLRRLQTLLLLMLLWDLLTVMAAFSFGSALMKIDGTEIGGLFAAKASFSGAGLVPVAVYLYGIVRNPIRHPGVLWVGVVEQAAVILAATYHVAASDITTLGAVIPIAVSVVFLVLLLANQPPSEGRA